jgi:DNA-binding transcriptional LysR family regulator
MFTGARERTKWILYSNGKVHEIHLRGRIAVGDPAIQQRLCLDGAGIAILPNWIALDNVRRKQLLRVLPEWTPASLELYVLYPTRLSMTPKLNAFLRFMDDVVPKS